MKSSNPDEIIEKFEEQEKVPDKRKKKKPKTKKSDHKHIYDKFLIVEEKPAYLASFKNNIIYHTYKKCSICGKTEWENLPQYMIDDLVKTFNKNPLSIKLLYCHIDNRKDVEYLKNKYPDIIEVTYLDL